MKQLIILLATISLLACTNKHSMSANAVPSAAEQAQHPPFIHQDSNSYLAKVAAAALAIKDPTIKYVADYVSIPYPNGDVPAHTGVCTDVVIRAYRRLGIDLQKLVHQDMKANFSSYPTIWGKKTTDPNIDHRRVPNLMTFFSRKGKSLPITDNGKDYLPGAIVTWILPKGLTHIGIVVNRSSADGKRPLIMHNIGNGQIVEDCLFKFDITGHYHFQPK